MQTTIILTYPSYAKCVVKKDDTLESGDNIAKVQVSKKKETINISKLLSISPEKITKYLKKTPGLKVNKGEVLAEKSGLFKSYVLKSPVSGFIKEVNVKRGTATLEYEAKESAEKYNLLTPVSGKVVSVGKGKVEVEIDLPLFKGKSGQGRSVYGQLVSFGDKKLDILEVKSDVYSSIVLAKGIPVDVSVKLETLGAKGAVLLFSPDYFFPLPFLQVEKDVFDKLSKQKGADIWLRPEEKEIIVIS